jgi:hypothetical protein
MLRTLTIITLGLCFFSAGVMAADQELRPVTHEDVWLMQRIGSPVASPDGSRAVVSVTQPSYEKDDTSSDLWLLRVDGQKKPCA